MKKLFLFSILAFGMLIFGVASCNDSDKTGTGQSESKALYQCPMDCEKGKMYEKPGQCPVCGMDLEKTETTHTTDSANHVN